MRAGVCWLFTFMDIHTAAHYMRHGYRIRRAKWVTPTYVYISDVSRQLCMCEITPWYKFPHGMVPSIDDLLATDWELITTGITKYFPVTYSD